MPLAVGVVGGGGSGNVVVGGLGLAIVSANAAEPGGGGRDLRARRSRAMNCSVAEISAKGTFGRRMVGRDRGACPLAAPQRRFVSAGGGTAEVRVDAGPEAILAGCAGFMRTRPRPSWAGSLLSVAEPLAPRRMSKPPFAHERGSTIQNLSRFRPL